MHHEPSPARAEVARSQAGEGCPKLLVAAEGIRDRGVEVPGGRAASGGREGVPVEVVVVDLAGERYIGVTHLRSQLAVWSIIVVVVVAVAVVVVGVGVVVVGGVVVGVVVGAVVLFHIETSSSLARATPLVTS